MDLRTTLNEDLKSAMKAHASLKVSVLRMLLAEIKKREIDSRTADSRKSLDDSDILRVVSTLVKQRNESIEAFKKGGRQDLVDQETQELGILKAYLPTPLSTDEVRRLVSEAIRESGASGLNDIGKVMKLTLTKVAGRADGKSINEIARDLLTPK